VVDSSLWRAESAAGIFTGSRVRRINNAQDALTHVEEAVYDALWGVKKKGEPETDRLAQMGYAELSGRSRVSKRTIQSVIDRLIDKGFIEIHEPADISSRKPTVYRVLSYGAVLKRTRETGRSWVVRTGRGVFYAHRLAATVEAASHSTVAAEGIN
jgi:DNA-binding MarR family transcriptional regulator